MHSLLLYDFVGDYLTRRGPFRAAHLALAQKASTRGELVLGGALQEPADLGVLVFAGDDPSTAIAFAQADPYVQHGLVKSWRVRKWNTVVGAGCTPPASPPAP